MRTGINIGEQHTVTADQDDIATLSAFSDDDPARATFGDLVRLAEQRHVASAFLSAAKNALRSAAVETRSRV